MMDKYISIPVSELKKLEESRVQLYEFLQGKLSSSEVLNLTYITAQMWRIANIRNWNYSQPDTTTLNKQA